MKTNTLIYTLLYVGFVLMNVIITSNAIIMITIEREEMMDTGLLILFLELLVFFVLKRRSPHDIEESEKLMNH